MQTKYWAIKFQKTEILQSTLLEHNGIKLETNKTRYLGKPQILGVHTFLNNLCIKGEITKEIRKYKICTLDGLLCCISTQNISLGV